MGSGYMEIKSLLLLERLSESVYYSALGLSHLKNYLTILIIWNDLVKIDQYAMSCYR